MSKWVDSNDQSGLYHSDLPLQILILSDGPASDELATSICEGVGARLPGQATIGVNIQRFDLLNAGVARSTAGEDISHADVLLVAADGTRPLPEALEELLGKWLLAWEAARFGLVAVLRNICESQRRASPAYLFLEELATRAGVEFIAHAEPRRRAVSAFNRRLPGAEPPRNDLADRSATPTCHKETTSI